MEFPGAAGVPGAAGADRSSDVTDKPLTVPKHVTMLTINPDDSDDPKLLEKLKSLKSDKERLRDTVAGADRSSDVTDKPLTKPVILLTINPDDIDDPELQEKLKTLKCDKERLRDTVAACKFFYSMQAMHSLRPEEDVKQVPIYFAGDLHSDWKDHLRNSISEINKATPGLNLYVSDKESNARIIIQKNKENGCATWGNILKRDQAVVKLYDNWGGSWKRTSTHELLHALGFQHEMKRRYASLYVAVTCKDPSCKRQYEENDACMGISRFDPWSIMMYRESDNMKRKSDGDSVWRLKNDKQRPEVMSELDKVGLNLVYSPCKTNNYNPTIAMPGGILYCGRKVMASHNTPGPSRTDGRCGPNNGPNCHACRVLNDPRSIKREQLDREGKWQGWSGNFFCGKLKSTTRTEHRRDPATSKVYSFTSDGRCGPNNGQPCNECGAALNPSYDCNKFYGIWKVVKKRKLLHTIRRCTIKEGNCESSR